MFRCLIISTLLRALTASAQEPAAPPTLIQQKITAAEAAVRKAPKNSEAYNDLAAALVYRARETADPKYYRQAEEALGNSFRLAPDNFSGQKIRVQILMGRHELVPASELAKALNLRVPDDVPVYGLVADAAIELGDYREAEEAAQWMLNLRPPSAASLMPAARLRELFGDVEGALEFLNAALRMTGSRDTLERAQILVQIARLSVASGKVEAANKVLHQVLLAAPDYHPARTELARVRSAQQQHTEAIALWRRECEDFPHDARNFHGLADALDQAGLHEEAASAYADFERQARGLTASADNANRELILFYAGGGQKPEQALTLARREILSRHDVYTLDAYAWALYANHRYTEAGEQIEKALALGIRDSGMLRRAEAIHLALQKSDARRLTGKSELHWTVLHPDFRPGEI